eukprot:3746888-Ditylum_brightwellii.AAC.1
MTRIAPSAEETIADFSQHTVPKAPGEPIYKTTHIIHKILQENAASINSNAGGGAHEHLALVLTPGHYHQVTGHVFAPPTHPGPTPPNPRAFFATQDLQAQRDNYFAALYAYKVYHATDKALVKQKLSAFDERFYKALRDRLVGYRNRTVANFLHHLYGNYGQITSTMITKSEKHMATTFNPGLPIKALFAQISNRQDLAVAAAI